MPALFLRACRYHPDEYWNKVIEVNLNAQFVLSREFGKDMAGAAAAERSYLPRRY